MEQFVADIGLRDFLKEYNPDQPRDDHGRWGSGTGTGNSGMTRGQMIGLCSKYDKYQSRVYAAEVKVDKASRTRVDNFKGLEKPVAPEYPREAIKAAQSAENWDESRRLSTEYKQAFGRYDRAFDKYANDYSIQNLQSDLAKQYLDGTKQGVDNYVKAVTSSDWFQKAYGNGDPIGRPIVSTTMVQSYGGRYKLSGFVNSIAINQPYAQDETTILHEIAHYAQTISATNGYEPHGVGFAETNLNLTEKVIGSGAAERLANAYLENGVPVAKP